jgi:hypothetical protein
MVFNEVGYILLVRCYLCHGWIIVFGHLPFDSAIWIIEWERNLGGGGSLMPFNLIFVTYYFIIFI